MASDEVFRARLFEAEKDALVAKLNAAGALLGVGKPAKMIYPNSDGTWDVGCILEGEADLLENVLSSIFLDIDLP